MNDAITHRGPDEDGTWLDPGIGLAARRLSIIDVAGGAQPIPNEDRTRWVALITALLGFVVSLPLIGYDGAQAGIQFAENEIPNATGDL